MTVKQAILSDFNHILEWLWREYNQDGVGFWYHRKYISEAFRSGELWVIRREEAAVAFQVGHYAPEILCVQKMYRKQGLATELFNASLDRAKRDDVTMLSLECAPAQALPFWKKLGFEQFTDPFHPEQIRVRRILPRTFGLSADAPKVQLEVAFGPELFKYKAGTPANFAYQIMGARNPSGTIDLLNRAISPIHLTRNGETFVKIVVDGVQRYFHKAAHPDAVQAGVKQDHRAGTFYIDRVNP